MNMDSDSSEEEEEFEQVQRQPQRPQQPFKVETESFPEFGGPVATAPASTMNFSSAWASSAAPKAMPEVVSRPKRRAQAPSAEAAGGAVQDAPAATAIPWRPSDWGNARSAPLWSGPAPRKFMNTPREDPYCTVMSGSPQAPKERAAPKQRAEAAAPAPEPEKPKRERREVQRPKEDSDGFTSVATRKHRPSGDKPEAMAKAVETYSAYDALLVEEPVEKKEKKEKKPEAPKQESKNGKKKKPAKAQKGAAKAQPKAEKQPKAKAAPKPKEEPKEEPKEQKTKKKSTGKRGSKGKGGGGGGQRKPKEQAGLPIAYIVCAAVVAAGVAYYSVLA